MRCISLATWQVVHAALESASVSPWFGDQGILERSRRALRWASGCVTEYGPGYGPEELVEVLRRAVDRAMFQCVASDVTDEGVDALVHLAQHLKSALERVRAESEVSP